MHPYIEHALINADQRAGPMTNNYLIFLGLKGKELKLSIRSDL